jgi:hypothetical protein
MGKLKLHRKVVDLRPFNEWKLDVFVGGTYDQLNEVFKARYGVEYDDTDNCVYSIESSMESELKGYKRIVMRLQSFDISVMVHELLHVLWHGSKWIGYEMKFESQEWQACMIEYLYTECKDRKTYELV